MKESVCKKQQARIEGGRECVYERKRRWEGATGGERSCKVREEGGSGFAKQDC